MLDFKEKMKINKVTKFTQVYTLSKELGAGAFGSVYLGKHK